MDFHRPDLALEIIHSFDNAGLANGLEPPGRGVYGLAYYPIESDTVNRTSHHWAVRV